MLVRLFRFIHFSAFACLLLVAPVSLSAQEAKLSNAEIEQALTHFYTKPNFGKLYQAIETMVAEERASGVINYETLSLFFSEVFRRSPKVLPSVVDHFSRYKNDLNIMPWMAAWLSGTNEGRDLVARLKGAGYDQIHTLITAAPPVDVRNFEPRNKAVIDGLWIFFYAAGDLRDVARVFETAMFEKKNAVGEFQIKDPALRKQIQDYAAGSLVVHAVEHKAVLNFLAKSRDGAPEAIRKKVDDMLQSALILARQREQAAGNAEKPETDR